MGQTAPCVKKEEVKIMKLATQFKATLVAIEEKSMTGSNNKYYQLAVLQGSEPQALSLIHI